MKPIISILVLAGLCLLLAAGAVAQTTPAPDSAQAAPGLGGDVVYPMTPERTALLESYSSFVNIWRFVALGISLGVFALILFTGLSAKLRDWAQVGRKSFFVAFIYTALLMTVISLLELPSSYYREFVIESEYGFMTQSVGGWLLDSIKYLGIYIVVASVVVWVLYRLMAKMERWWLAFTMLAIPFIVVMAVIVPVYINPLFNDFEPLHDKTLTHEIELLADDAGVHGAAIYEVDNSRRSTKVNAYVTGVFGTKRIVLYDTMLKNFSDPEILFVTAHELGHYVMNHVWYGIILSVLFTGFALWITDKASRNLIGRFKKRFGFSQLSHLASLPLIMAFITVITFVGGPIVNGYSRLMEHQADVYAMELSNADGETAARTFDKLSVYNLSDPNPHPFIEFWFYSHPSLKSRMEFARSFHKQRAGR